MILYGIPNCDTVKRARTWLAEQRTAHDFHDFKKAGVPAGRLADRPADDPVRFTATNATSRDHCHEWHERPRVATRRRSPLMPPPTPNAGPR